MTEKHYTLIEEIALFGLLLATPFIGIQSIRNFIFPYNLLFHFCAFVFFVLQFFPFKKEEKFSINSGQIALILFLFFSFASFLFSNYPYGNKVEFYQEVAYVTLAFAIAGKKEIKYLKILWLLLAIGFFESLYSIFQIFGVDYLRWSVTFNTRGFGTLVNPNHFVAYLVLIFPLGLYLFFQSEAKIHKLISGLFLILIAAGIIIASSQGGILAFVFSTSFFFFYLTKKKIFAPEERINLAIIIFAILIFIFSVFALTPKNTAKENIVSRIAKVVEVDNPSIQGRILNWVGTFKMSKDMLLLGWGPGTYKDVFMKYRPVEFNKYEPAEHPRLYAHNDFIQIVSELGIISFCLFVLLLYIFFKNIIKNPEKENALFSLTIGSVLIAGLTAGFFNTAFIFHYFIMPSASLFWLILGLGLRGSEEIEVKWPGKEITGIMLSVFLLFGLMFQVKVYRSALFNLKGNKYLRGESGERAVFNFQQAVQIDKQNDIYHYVLSMEYFRKYFNEKEKNYLLLSKDEVQEAIKLNPYSPVYHYHLALIYYTENSQDRDIKVSEELNKALELNPAYYLAYIFKAEQAEQRGDFKDAEQIYKKIYEIEQGDKNSDIYYELTRITNQPIPNLPDVYNLIGRFFYKKNELFKSVYFYEKLAKSIPENGIVFDNLGAIYREMGNNVKAEEFLKKAISLEPENIEFHKNLAYTYKVANNDFAYKNEMATIEKISQKSPPKGDPPLAEKVKSQK